MTKYNEFEAVWRQMFDAATLEQKNAILGAFLRMKNPNAKQILHVFVHSHAEYKRVKRQRDQGYKQMKKTLKFLTKQVEFMVKTKDLVKKLVVRSKNAGQ